MMWLKILLRYHAPCNESMIIFCDNQATIKIASNPMFHEHTKHVEVNCHFVHEAVMNGKIHTPFTRSEDQTTDIFTKALGLQRFFSLI